ncbi:hypothetical protein NDU88_001667 [Pleurodeles waltl]|uniref:Uncharacterized protein n=1 Tax=Pleurodeles waltl TaxID=8319 RepID=A0AAV7T0J1_PLEWA|nr:hypothetical protein NDU88_001667 [Pleurodeles waltl]
MTTTLKKQDKRISAEKSHISNLENDNAMLEPRKLLDLTKVLKAIQAKNKDLEYKSRFNKLHLMGIFEPTNAGNMAEFIESLLKALSGD